MRKAMFTYCGRYLIAGLLGLFEDVIVDKLDLVLSR
jgi:hypothetical protein